MVKVSIGSPEPTFLFILAEGIVIASFIFIIVCTIEHRAFLWEKLQEEKRKAKSGIARRTESGKAEKSPKEDSTKTAQEPSKATVEMSGDESDPDLVHLSAET